MGCGFPPIPLHICGHPTVCANLLLRPSDLEACLGPGARSVRSQPIGGQLGLARKTSLRPHLIGTDNPGFIPKNPAEFLCNTLRSSPWPETPGFPVRGRPSCAHHQQCLQGRCWRLARLLMARLTPGPPLGQAASGHTASPKGSEDGGLVSKCP